MRFARIQHLVYDFVVTIPKGRVTTYGHISRSIGINCCRLIGRALHLNPNPDCIPCHRVVFADGSLSSQYAFGGKVEQKKRLIAEGIKFRGNNVELSQLLTCR